MNSDLPSRTEAWARLQRADPPDWVLRHCRAVEGLTAALLDAAEARGLTVARDVALRGALLHDIGRSVTQDLHHAYMGADMVRPDWPEPVARIIECHTGAGIEPEEAEAHGLPPRDYMPRSLEERIVAHADNLYSGDKRLTLHQVESKYEARGLRGAWLRIKALHDALSRELDVDLEDLEPVRLELP